MINLLYLFFIIFSGNIFAEKKLSVTSNRQEFIIDESKFVFTDNVFASLDNYSFSASFVQIKGANAGAMKEAVILAYGNPLICVIDGRYKYTIEASSLSYSSLDGVAVLTGNVVLMQEGNIFKGDVLTYNESTGQVIFSSSVKNDDFVESSFNINKYENRK